MDETEWVHLGEFSRGIGYGDRVRFTVERSAADHARHRIRSDEGKGAGPRLVAVFTEPPTAPVQWEPAWNGDRMSPGIEADARAIARPS